MEKKLQKVCLVDYKLLLAKDFWQVHYQILLIISLKKFIKLNVNMNMMIKNVELVSLNTNIVSAFLNPQAFRMI